jgi:hypothetical protein
MNLSGLEVGNVGNFPHETKRFFMASACSIHVQKHFASDKIHFAFYDFPQSSVFTQKLFHIETFLQQK